MGTLLLYEHFQPHHTTEFDARTLEQLCISLNVFKKISGKIYIYLKAGNKTQSLTHVRQTLPLGYSCSPIKNILLMKQYDGDYRFWVNISLEKATVLVKIMLTEHKKSTINSCVTRIPHYIAHTHTYAGTSTRLYTSPIEHIAIPDAKLHPLQSPIKTYQITQQTHSVSKDLMRCAQHCNFVLELRFLLHKASIPHYNSTAFFLIFTLPSRLKIKPRVKGIFNF